MKGKAYRDNCGPIYKRKRRNQLKSLSTWMDRQNMAHAHTVVTFSQLRVIPVIPGQ